MNNVAPFPAGSNAPVTVCVWLGTVTTSHTDYGCGAVPRSCVYGLSGLAARPAAAGWLRGEAQREAQRLREGPFENAQSTLMLAPMRAAPGGSKAAE